MKYGDRVHYIIKGDKDYNHTPPKRYPDTKIPAIYLAPVGDKSALIKIEKNAKQVRVLLRQLEAR